MADPKPTKRVVKQAVPTKTAARKPAERRVAKKAVPTKTATARKPAQRVVKQVGRRLESRSRDVQAEVQWQPGPSARFVIDVVGGTRRAAELLEVAPSQPSRWASGESLPGPAQARMLVDIEYVLTHALLVWADPEVARDWLTTPNARLDEVRPVDWIRRHGTADVVDALRSEAAGGYA